MPSETAALSHKAVSQPGLVFQTQPYTAASTPTHCFTLQWPLREQTAEPDFLGPFLMTWVIQGKSPNHYVTQFLYLQNKDNSHITGKWRRLNKRVCVNGTQEAK